MEGSGGCEWVVEAFGCDAAALADVDAMGRVFAALIDEMALRPVAPALWHHFPPPGGVTGVCVLAESHLACHTFPEHRSLCLNLFCCTPRPAWPFEKRLAEMVGAERVTVRHLERTYAGETLASR